MSRPDDTRSPRGNPPGTWPRGQEPQWPEPGNEPRASHRTEPRWDNEPQYHYPSAPQDQGYAQPGAAPQGFDYAAGPPPASTGEPAYAPRFGSYAPAGQREAHPAPPAPHYDDQNHGYVPPQQWSGGDQAQPRAHDDGLSRYPSHQQAGAGFGYAGDAHGQQGLNQQGYWQQGEQPTYDRGYGAQAGYAQLAPDPYAHQHAQAHGYQQADPYAQQGYGQPHGYQDPSFGPAQYDQHGDADGDYADEYEDEPPRRRRGLLVAGALLGAVAIGGGLAFVYKTFGQGGKRGGPTPLIARSEKPTKVAPSDTQGKQFENASKKIMARVGEAPPPQAPAAASPAPSVPGLIVSPPPGAEPARESAVASASEATPTTRRVQTVPIGADGQPAPRPQVDSRPSQAIPGVSLDNTLNPPSGIRGPIATAPAAPPPAAPRRVASAAPAETAAAPIAAPPPARAPERRVASRTPAAPPAEPAPARASSGGSGYVVVLSSQKDPMAALRVFADLQQKYPGPLSGRKAEVQEANLGEKGVWQRLVVGPPASRQAANELCAKLKSAGYKDCWTKRY